MATDKRKIEKLIIEALKNNKPMSERSLINLVSMDLGRGEVEDSQIEKVIESMADRMIILETSSGKFRLNEG